MRFVVSQRAERSETGRRLAAVERSVTATLRDFSELVKNADDVVWKYDELEVRSNSLTAGKIRVVVESS